MDRDRIFSKGIERGLAEPGANLSDEEIFSFIFHPGFSTTDKVTDVSGRGVGMDVVNRYIEAHHGNIRLSSERRAGTKITMSLPLTLATFDGMVVMAEGERYIIPILSIYESIKPEAGQVSSVAKKGEIIEVRGKLYPFYRLAELLGTGESGSEEEEGLAVLVEEKGKRIALFVDRLLGQQQVMIKSLGEGIGKTPGISGAAIMPDGRAALVLDIVGIIEMVEE